MATSNKPSKPQYPWEVPVTSPGVSGTSKTRGFLSSIFGGKGKKGKETIDPAAQAIADDLTNKKIEGMAEDELSEALNKINDFLTNTPDVTSTTTKLLKERMVEIEEQLKVLNEKKEKTTDPAAQAIADDLTDEKIKGMAEDELSEALKKINDFLTSTSVVTSATTKLLKERMVEIEYRLKEAVNKRIKNKAKNKAKEAAREDKVEQMRERLLRKSNKKDAEGITLKDIARGSSVKKRSQKAKGLPADPTERTEDDLETDNQLKGREYFDKKCEESDERIDLFFQNRFNLQALMALLINHRRSKLEKQASIAEKMNLKIANLVELFQAIVAGMTHWLMPSGKIVELLDYEGGLTAEYVIYDRLFKLGSNANPEEIDKKIKLFNDAMNKFIAFRSFCSVHPEDLENESVAKKILDTYSEIKDLEDIENFEEYTSERELILNNADLPNCGGKLIDEDIIKIFIKPKVSGDEKLKDEDFAELRDKGDIGSLNALESAFRMRPDLFDAIKGHDFKGNSLLDIRRDLNGKFPDKQLGSLLMIITQPDDRNDLIKLIAERFGITTKNALFDQIQKINKVIGELYPNIASSGTGSAAGTGTATGSEDLFNV
jgi:hypothetical protein